MSEQLNADRSAYPIPGNPATAPGLTKRELAAMLLLQGACANPNVMLNTEHRRDEEARLAVTMADALLRALEASQP